jgi:hypothetical protein
LRTTWYTASSIRAWSRTGKRSRLERIVSSPSYHLSTEEKDLLWRFQFTLVDERRTLTKSPLAVDWTVESEVVQVAELWSSGRRGVPSCMISWKFAWLWS